MTKISNFVRLKFLSIWFPPATLTIWFIFPHEGFGLHFHSLLRFRPKLFHSISFIWNRSKFECIWLVLQKNIKSTLCKRRFDKMINVIIASLRKNYEYEYNVLFIKIWYNKLVFKLRRMQYKRQLRNGLKLIKYTVGFYGFAM